MAAPAAESDPNSSSSTLVHAGEQQQQQLHPALPPGVPFPPAPGAPLTPHSPFSPSFDPNMPTPPVPQHPLYPIREANPFAGYGAGYASNTVGVGPRMSDADIASALWAHRLSASFGAIADQIAAASKALATPAPLAPAPVPLSPTLSAGPSAPTPAHSAEAAALAARLDAIERAQAALAGEVKEVQERLARVQVSAPVNGAKEARGAKDPHGDVTVVEVQEEEGGGELKSAIEELQKKVDGAIETIRLDQARLYARLHNATVTTNKMQIKAPTTASGKPPQNFPSTKGEFEHLTKERYEAILKAYGVTPKGDTAAKREALREFIGLTPAN